MGLGRKRLRGPLQFSQGFETIKRVSTNDLILSVLSDVEPLMQAAFDSVRGTPPSGSALDQVFLLDGREVVVDYLEHGEPGLALEHVIYMISALPQDISQETYQRLSSAGSELGLPSELWEHFGQAR